MLQSAAMADEYIHGRDPKETDRLIAQAAFVGGILLDGVEVPRTPERVLDLGCGVGAMTRLLIEKGAVHPIGADRAVNQASEAKRLTPKGAAMFAVADGTALPFANDSFELVYTSWFFEHVPDVQAILAEVWRVLELGGTLWAAEVENASLLTHPRSEALERTWAALNQAQLDLHGDPFIGRKMFGHLKQAGFLADVWTHTFHGHSAKPGPFKDVIHEFVEILKSVRENVVTKRKLVDAKEYDRAVEDLAALPSTPGATFTYTFMRCCGTKERRGMRAPR